MALFVPALLGFIGLTAPRMFKGRALAFLAFFFLLGFATYLYLPIRSLTEPAFNWGDPQTFQQFLTHISDRKDAKVHTVLFWRQLPYQIYMYAVHISNEFAVFGVALGLLGYVAIFRKISHCGFYLAWPGSDIRHSLFVRGGRQAGVLFHLSSSLPSALDLVSMPVSTCVVTLYQQTSHPYTACRLLYISLGRHCCHPWAIPRTPLSCCQSGSKLFYRAVWQTATRTAPP